MIRKNNSIHSKRAIHLSTWWLYFLNDTKITYFSDLVSSRKDFSFSFFCRKHSPINLIPFLLSSKIFFKFRSYNLWLIVWIFVIVFWLRKIFFLNFNNIIFYQCNSLTRVLWVQNDKASCVVIDNFCYISQREVSKIATIKEGRFNYLFIYPFTHYRRIFRVRNIFVFYKCIYRYAYFL